MNGQLTLADLTLRQVEALPPVMRWRKLLRRARSEQRDLSTATLRNVGEVLALHADREGGSCWPSVETIAVEASVSRRSVLYALAELERLQLLYRRRRGRHESASYRLLLPQPVEKPVDNSVDADSIGADGDVHRCSPLHPRSALRTAQI